MAAINWPTGLPPRPNQSGAGTTLGAGTVESKLATGPTFRRQRSNAKPDRCEAILSMSDEQLVAFDEFFRVTTRGCLRFNWTDQQGNSAEVRFVGAPSWTSPMDGLWHVRVSYEVLP